MTRPRVEHQPRIGASALAWTGLLDRRWEGGPDVEAPWPWADLAATFEDAFESQRVMTQLRPTASYPTVVAEDQVQLAVSFEFVESWCFTFDDDAMQTRFDLVSTPAHFGGARWWFRCPDCGVRRAHLYPGHIGYRWSCRECWRLTYNSRAKYGGSARWGNGWGALAYVWDRHDAKCEALDRRNYRRRISRDRQRHRDAHGTDWPVAMTCAARVNGST